MAVAGLGMVVVVVAEAKKESMSMVVSVLLSGGAVGVGLVLLGWLEVGEGVVMAALAAAAEMASEAVERFMVEVW